MLPHRTTFGYVELIYRTDSNGTRTLLGFIEGAKEAQHFIEIVQPTSTAKYESVTVRKIN